MMRALAAMFISSFLVAAPPSTGEWRQFRGPNGTGVGTSTGLPVEMDAAHNLVWKVATPSSYSSPVLTESRVYLTGHEDMKLFTVALDRTTGRELWRAEASKPWPVKPKGPASPSMSSPATDGENVYVIWEHSGLFSYDKNGKPRWNLAVGDINTPYGFGSSPVVIDSTLVLICDQDGESFVMAVHKDTGKQLWKTARPHAQHSFPSPVVFQPRGKDGKLGPKQVIVSGSHQVAGYSLATGEKLWWVDGMAWQAKQTPLVAGDSIYVLSSMPPMQELGPVPQEKTLPDFLEKYDANKDGKMTKDEAPTAKPYGMRELWFLWDLNKNGQLDAPEIDIFLKRNSARSGLYAIRPAGAGDLTASAVAWSYEKGLPNIPSPLLYQGLLYVVREGGILTALDPATGKMVKQGRVTGALGDYFASPVAADGKLFLLTHDGKLAVLKAGAEFEVLKVNELDETSWATPALDGDQVFVKTQSALYCFALKKAG